MFGRIIGDESTLRRRRQMMSQEIRRHDALTVLYGAPSLRTPTIIIANILRRIYQTIIFCALAILNRTDADIFYIMIIFGIVIDILRNFCALDISSSPEEIGAALNKSANDSCYNKSYDRRVKSMYCFAGIVMAYALIAVYLSRVSYGFTATYISMFRPVHDLGALLFPVISTHPNSLIEHGYPDRALMISHIYSISSLGMLFAITIYPFSTAWAQCNIEAFATVKRENGVMTRIESSILFRPFKMVWVSVAVLFAYYFYENMNEIDYDGYHRHPYNIHVSDIPLVISIMAPWLFALSFWNLYSAMVLYEFKRVY